MKKISIILICIVAGVLVFLGKMQYDNKIAQAGKMEPQNTSDVSTESSLLALTSNMSIELQTKIKPKLDSKEVISILIVGSDAIMNKGSDTQPWPLQVKKALEENYGNQFHVEIMNFENITTNHLIETKGHEKIAAEQPDILIMEPLLLNDNGFVKIEDTLLNLEKVIHLVNEANPETHIIIQPPNPIFEPVNYLDQVNALEKFSSEKNIEYFDHWEEWPDTSSDSIKEVLQGTYPNGSGQEIWAKYIIEYLIAN